MKLHLGIREVVEMQKTLELKALCVQVYVIVVQHPGTCNVSSDTLGPFFKSFQHIFAEALFNCLSWR